MSHDATTEHHSPEESVHLLRAECAICGRVSPDARALKIHVTRKHVNARPAHPCSVDGCEKPSVARGWCHAHYANWRRRGTPIGMYEQGDKPARFWTKVRQGEGCWMWTAGTVGGLYGVIRWGGRLQVAHRIAYQLNVGPIPDGMEIDHLCRVTLCVNPSHLEAVTPTENRQRAMRARYPKEAEAAQAVPLSDAANAVDHRRYLTEGEA